jgi:hypothetical protein
VVVAALALVITGKEAVEWDETDSPSSTNNDYTFLNHKVGLPVGSGVCA